MAKDLGTFDFKKLSVILGVSQLTGFADGEALTVSEENDAFNSIGGADGHVDRIKNNNNSLTITVRLRQTSPTNQILSAIHNADRVAGTTLPLLIKDRSGNTLISATSAWIIKHPDTGFGTESSVREWTIKTGSNYVKNLAGND